MKYLIWVGGLGTLLYYSITLLDIPPHPLGIEPWGNYYLRDKSAEVRSDGLGLFAILEDRMILENILTMLDPKTLCNLACTSHAFYIFASDDSLWKDLFINENMLLANSNVNTINSFPSNTPASKMDEGIIYSTLIDSFLNRILFFKNWKLTYSIYLRLKPKMQANKTMVVTFRGDNKILATSDGIIDEFIAHPFSIVTKNFYSDFLYDEWQCCTLDTNLFFNTVDNIDRIQNMSFEEFSQKYGRPNVPVIIQGVVETWPAFTKWKRDGFIKSYGDKIFKVGALKATLKDYFNYADQTKEERPMYLFDNDFGELFPELLHDYEVPSYFQTDFFSLIPTDDRPSYRWVLIGPKRSGSTFHKDPNSTSAWNATVQGHKKWIFYPPNEVPPGVFPSADHFDVTAPSSPLEWFLRFYNNVHRSKTAFKPIECIQKPGDIVYVPNGWWHQVVNLDETIAVTQNFVSEWNLGNVVKFLKSKKKKRLWGVFSGIMEKDHHELMRNIEKVEEAEQQKYRIWEADDSFSFLS